MGARGPARRPKLQVVREGNPDHRGNADLEGGMRLRPEAPRRPDWRQWFPVVRGENADELKRCRNDATDEWERIVPPLDAQGLRSAVDRTLLVVHCVTVARLNQLERRISLEGPRQESERGWTRNGNVTTVMQYRSNLKWTVAQLGLSPVARDSITPSPEGSPMGRFDSYDPFDR